ncbi:ATP-binding protein [Faecalimonas sp.]
MYNVKYIEDNLVFTTDGRVYAYYEMKDYNYAFISLAEKQKISDEIGRLISQSKCKDIHLLQVATEDSFRKIQEQSKKCINGEMKNFASRLVDLQTDVLIEKYGEYQVKYRHYIGFSLELADEKMNLKQAVIDLWRDFLNFLGEVRSDAMGDYQVMSQGMIGRYRSIEKMLFWKISNKFSFERLTPREIGYLIEKEYGNTGVSYEDYEYQIPTQETSENIIVKKYDFLKLTNALLRETPYSLEIERDEGKMYSAFFSISTIIEDLVFPNSELLYHQQSGITFPVDTSIRIEVVDNKSAIRLSHNKEMETKDLIEHALKKDVDPSDDVLEANETAKDLGVELKRTKSDMYKVSYLIRVWAKTKEELERCCMELKDFYDGYRIKLVRPRKNMLDFHYEFLPGGKRAVDDYIQHVTEDFISGLGFGATTKLGNDYGIYYGFNKLTGKPVYLRPELAAQGVKGAITNSLASAFLGATGWGKSVAVNTLLYYICLFGGRVFILDPKSERGEWGKYFPELKDELNIINLTSNEENRGMLDPFVILNDIEESKRLAIDVITYLTGMSVSDGDRFPLLTRAVELVGKSEKRGMLRVIDELEKMEDEVAKKLAGHIKSFVSYSFAKLLFSNGEIEKKTISLDKSMNILQIADLMLPDKDTPVTEYTSVEMLSVAAMLIIGTFGLEYMESDKSVFKVMAIDEAWAMLGTAQGKALQNKSVRAGRSMNSGIYFITQGADDLGNKDIRNNIGMKFAFHSGEDKEIANILKFMNLDTEDEELYKLMRSLKHGECLVMDIYGNVGVMYVDLVFEELMEGFSTTPELKVVV